jgi:alpha-tubulin suppressor-like RCC1 family protein
MMKPPLVTEATGAKDSTPLNERVKLLPTLGPKFNNDILTFFWCSLYMNLERSFSSVAHHVLMVAQDGTLYGWGCNDKGGLGFHGTTKIPVKVPLPSTSPVSIGCGIWHTTLVTEDGSLYTCGDNSAGQSCAPVSEECVHKFTKIDIPAKFTHTRCGALFSAAVTEDGILYTWGDNEYGQLGDSRTKPQTCTPHPIDLPLPVTSITCGHYQIMVVLEDGSLYVWGLNGGKLGLGDDHGNKRTPHLHPTLTNVDRVFSGSSHFLALKRDGSLYAWGWNGYGSIGIEGDQDRDTPTLLFTPSVPPAPPRSILEVVCGGSHTILWYSDGTIWSFGYNLYGQLGVGDKEHRFHETQIKLKREGEGAGSGAGSGEGEGEIIAVGSGWYFSYAIVDDGSLWIWGYGKEDQLGSGGPSTSPVLYPYHKWDHEALKYMASGRIWRDVIQWLFLGRLDEASAFYMLPVEIIFLFVKHMPSYRRGVTKPGAHTTVNERPSKKGEKRALVATDSGKKKQKNLKVKEGEHEEGTKCMVQ